MVRGWWILDVGWWMLGCGSGRGGLGRDLGLSADPDYVAEPAETQAVESQRTAECGDLGADCVAGLALQAGQEQPLPMRVLVLVQELADGIGQGRVAAQVDRSLPTSVTESEAEIGPIATPGNRAPGGHDHALPGEQVAMRLDLLPGCGQACVGAVNVRRQATGHY